MFTLVMRRARVVAIVVALVAAVGGIAAATGSVNSAPSVYSAITPETVLNNRVLADGGSRAIVVAGGAGSAVPADATAVDVAITVSAGAADGNLRVFPHLDPANSQPAVHWRAGEKVTEHVTVPVAPDQQITLRNGAGAVTVSVQTTGFYAPAGATGPAGGVLTGTYPDPGLAPKAVTAAKISGAGGFSGQILTNTGTGAAWYTETFESQNTDTITVHPTGAHVADGATLRSAITAGYALVRIEPGTYDIGATTINVPLRTSIVGAGPDATIIQFAGATNAFVTTGTQAISDLTLAATGAASGSTRGFVATSGRLALRNVVVTVGGGSNVLVGAMVATTGAMTIDASSVTVTGTSTSQFVEPLLQNGSTGTLTVRNSTITGSSAASNIPADGINAFGPVVVEDTTILTTASNGGQAWGVVVQAAINVTLDDVRVTAATHSLAATAGTITAAASMVAGGAPTAAGGGSVKCVASYNAAYNPIGSGCT